MNSPTIEFPPKSWLTRVFPISSIPRRPPDVETLAFHEAGHAIVGLFFCLPIDKAELEIPTNEKEVLRGRVTLKNGSSGLDDSEIPLALKQKVALELGAWYAAGLQAELLHHDLTVSGPVFPGSHDYTNLNKALAWGFGHPQPVYYCQQLSKAILTGLWPAVESLAEALLVQHCVSVDECLEILRNSSSTKKVVIT